jgi:hypothetical protein
MTRRLLAAFSFLLVLGHGASAQNCATYPNVLANGTNADANQVMANFNLVRDCVNNLTLSGGGGMTNRLINPNGQVWQRANSAAAAIADITYAFDRWYGMTQSAGVTASQLTNVENGTPYMMRLSQASASAQRFGIAQVVERSNSADLRGKAVVLSARVRMSASTTLRYAIIEWTGTADTVTKDFVLDWNSGTFTPGNFFTSTSTTITAIGSTSLSGNALATISLTGTIGGSANNVAVMFWTDSPQAQNATLDIGKVQLEIGTAPTSLAVRSATEEMLDCKRYYQQVKWYLEGNVSGPLTRYSTTVTFSEMRTVPSTSRITTGTSSNIRSSDPANFVLFGALMMTTNSAAISAESAAAGTITAANFVDSLSAEL